jgi:predicted heme/steroid binding protein
MKSFSREDLSKYNGRNGAPAYVAYRGKIYDVSGSFLWKGGRHQVVHHAGTDLTDALEDAPHGALLLKRFPVVGLVRKDE